MFGQMNAVKQYLGFIQDGVGDGHRNDLYETGGWQILGSEGYEGRSFARIGEKPERPVKLRMRIAEIWTHLKGRERMTLEPVGRKRSRLMDEAVWLGYECAGVSQAESAKYFGIVPSGVHNAVNRLEKRWHGHPKRRKLLLNWARGLKK